jgi:hypothetical protein
MNTWFRYGLVACVAGTLSGVLSYHRLNQARVEIQPSPSFRESVPPAHPEPRTADAEAEAELERLRRENAELAKTLEAARAQMKTHEAVFNETRAELEELRRPLAADVMSSTLRAELKSGEVVVTGGYKLADGRRLYAFAKPIVENIDGVNVVKIESRYLSLTDEAGKTAGLDNLATNAANTLQHGEVWMAAEEQAVFASVKPMSDTHVESSPSVSVLSGRSATITLGEVQLKVTPTIAENGNGLGMELRLEQPQTLTVEPAASAARPEDSAGGPP